MEEPLETESNTRMGKKSTMERTTTTLDFLEQDLSTSPALLFEQLYVPDINRSETERILLEKRDERPDGIFILRDASRAPYTIPPDREHIFTISYWNTISTRFNHLFICSDDSKLSWSVLVDEAEFQSYPSLRDILSDVPSIRKTGIKNALVRKGSKVGDW